jgi:hypothetical protein
LSVAVLVQGFERRARIGNFTRVDHAIVVGVKRPDQREGRTPMCRARTGAGGRRSRTIRAFRRRSRLGKRAEGERSESQNENRFAEYLHIFSFIREICFIRSRRTSSPPYKTNKAEEC